MDGTDKKIIRELEKNSRQTNVEIAKHLKITEGTVRNRISELVKSGAINRFTVEISTKVGFTAFITIKIKPQTPTAEIVEKIKKISEIKNVYETAGKYDAIAMAVTDSAEQFNNIIEKIRQINGIIETESLTVLKIN